MPEHMPGPTAARGVYGFAMHLTFHIAFIAFLLWATVPEKWFHNAGITYLPQRYWAVAVPIFILTVMAVFAFVIYPSLGLLMTPDIDSMDTVTDIHARLGNSGNAQHNYSDGNDNEARRKVPCICKNQTFCMKHMHDAMDPAMFEKNVIPAVTDLNISKVSEALYL